MKAEDYEQLVRSRRDRANAIATAGGIEEALTSGTLPRRADVTLSEAVVLGLLRQGVTQFIGVFGHRSTEVAEVLRRYVAAAVRRANTTVGALCSGGLPVADAAAWLAAAASLPTPSAPEA